MTLVTSEDIKFADEKVRPEFEKLKKWRLKRLREMYAKRLSGYNKSKATGKPYSERKKITEDLELLKQMAEETNKAELLPATAWLEREDLKEIKDKGIEEFLWTHFTRITKTT